MSKPTSPVAEILTVASIILSLSTASMIFSKDYIDKARKTALEEEITNCVKKLLCENILNNQEQERCSLNEDKYLNLFLDKKTGFVFSKDKIRLHYSFGKDIECFVFKNKPLCEFLH